MRKILTIILAFVVVITAGIALADLNYTQGSGTTIFDFICFSTKHCTAQVPIDSTGTEKATSGNPLVVDTGATGNLIDAIKAPPGLATSGGWTVKLLDALTNSAVSVKASGGQLAKLYCWNPNASVVYIQVYNVASGSVMVGTTTPSQSYGMPPTNSAGFALSLVGDQYSTAISVAATTTATGGSAPGSAVDCNASFN